MEKYATESVELTTDQIGRLRFQSLKGRDIVFWTVYDNPTDFPGKFICRPHSISRGTFAHHMIGDTIEEVRAKIPRGLIQMPRRLTDDPKIVEIWF